MEGSGKGEQGLEIKSRDKGKEMLEKFELEKLATGSRLKTPLQRYGICTRKEVMNAFIGMKRGRSRANPQHGWLVLTWCLGLKEN